MSKYRRNEKELFPSPYATIGTKKRFENRKGSDDFRSDFQRDIHRIIYSQAFRRLRHKTQVFYFPQNDHVSTRLDHVLFVASAARTVARCLGLNEDLAEAIGLAHDIGHAPFGHQGEEFLNEIINKHPAIKKTIPSFSHEVYGLRVVDYLAKRDRERPGLDLTWEVRDGIISHCGEDFSTCRFNPGSKEKMLEKIQSKNDAGFPATLEGCIVRLIDKVAYCGKDIEDAIAAEIIKKDQVPVEIRKKLGETNGQIVGTFVEDIVRQSYDKNYIELSNKYGDLLNQMISFNTQYIYRSEKSEGYKKQAGQSLTLLFIDLLGQLKQLPEPQKSETSDRKMPVVYKVFYEFIDDMKSIYDDATPLELKVFDFIAGMTDSFTIRSFQELFVPQASV
jgi:dGTPase